MGPSWGVPNRFLFLRYRFYVGIGSYLGESVLNSDGNRFLTGRGIGSQLWWERGKVEEAGVRRGERSSGKASITPWSRVGLFIAFVIPPWPYRAGGSACGC